MAVTTADLVPPVGAKAGLPLTLVWADDLTDAAGAGSGYALFDGDLWVSGSVLTPSVPMVVSGANVSYVQAAELDWDALNFLGLTLATEGPRLNFGTGWLEHGQAVQDAGRGRHSSAHQRTFTPAATATITEPGRHVEHPRRDHPSARPGNHTWSQARNGTLKHGVASYDLQIGSQVSNTDSIVEAITHRSSVELPSNGVGATYGDRHDSAYLTSLWSAPINDMTTPTGLFQTVNDDAKEFSAHWGLNIRPLQTVLASGTPLSAPDSLNTATNHALTDGDSLDLPGETIQTILVSDIHTESGSSAETERLFPLGRVDLGNHAVTDTCGLIGYEGIISATAFLSVSRHANPAEIQSPPAHPLVPDDVWTEDGVGTFAAINVQVHSGLPYRRNGLSYTNVTAPLFRYGSDGTAVEGMTEALVTSGIRSQFKGSAFATQTNASRFHVGRANHVLSGATQTDLSVGFNQQRVGGLAHPTMNSTSKPADGFILGDTHTTGAWTQTITLSQDFLKDRVPTKVRIVPVLVRTEEVSVAAGASHPSSDAIAFDKPIVDYHVLVSLAPRDRLAAGATLTSDEVGDPTQRNAPASNRLAVNMNLEDEGCEIHHAIFRINPDTLERIYFDSTEPSATIYGADATAEEMSASVMPRHDSENGGWGLHQVTPFRPLANASWSQVPLLCAAIEAGGMYQRGGVSHLWDADAYGGEVFVAADAIEAAHLNGALGQQVWADGAGELDDPRGSELLIFRYAPSLDPLYTIKDTTATDNPLRTAMLAATATDFIGSVQTGSFDINQPSDAWGIHDWVFPQVELMRYLGREDKAAAMHPRHSQTGGDPILHPTLHAAALRFVDDGRMMLAAIQRDHIKSSDEIPSLDMPYPFNPDAGSGGGCPPGYYRSGDACVPITGGDDPSTGDEHLDPITGELIPGPTPTPNTGGSGGSHVGGGDSFDLVPTWSRIVANTSARSLILMWSDAKAEHGKARGGRARFDAEAVRIDGSDYYRQTWTWNDTWWSGSRIAWWFAESGMRAIPITYGSYPEVRCSYATLPRCLPHLMTTGVSHGYPLLQPVDRVAIKTGSLRDESGVDAWAQDRYDFLRRTRFVPTTIGFADYGPAANPHQELGWSGWSFPRYLYDPIGFGDNTQFFSDDPAAEPVSAGTAITPVAQGGWDGFASSTQFGHMKGPAAFSHHGPLHYGVSSSHHPFKVDRVWKQVHGGVGYDVPLHLLAPGTVHVRARAGGRGSLDLEMETPFHRTETRHLEGGALFNSGFDLGGKSTPDATRTHLGQFYLRTNLWVDDARQQSANALTGGLLDTDRVRGPMVSGNGLEVFWSDHPTDHFHAGAIPLMPGSDYDLVTIENERYAPAVLGRIDELSELDYVAMAEQLQSSVDVHVSSSTRPMWDSGAIVSGRGTGYRDTTVSSRVSQERGEMSGEAVVAARDSDTDHDHGMGKGQRICRTPEGTLHVFNIERSAQSGSSNLPVFVHYSKPLGSDLFWNRKALKTNPADASYDGKDEVGPLLTGTVNLRGAAFAADSKGTIHAVVETEDSGVHSLHYTYAKRVLVAYNPDPVYSWDWSEVTPVAIAVTSGTADLRQPSIAVDSADRVHLACRLVESSGSDYSHVIYTTMLDTETAFLPIPDDSPTTWTDTRWSLVSKRVSSPVVAADNQASATSHACIDHDAPKVCLLSDDRPIVFFRGDSAAAAATLDNTRELTAVYANVGRNETGTTDPAGRYAFDTDLAIHVTGIHNAAQKAAYDVLFYDAIIDERDRAFVVAIKGDAGRSVILTSFDASKPLADQHDATDGLGLTKALFIPKDASVRPDYKHLTMTTNGMGEVHMVLGFRLGGTSADYAGEVFRDGSSETTIAPLQWAAKPTAAADAYEEPASGVSWPTGGTYNQPQAGEQVHFMEVWMPTLEFSQDAGDPDEVVRSINIRWLSVPSMGYDATTGWFPVGAAQSLNGQEDFTHEWPQLRYQRFSGYDAAELDLRWSTNELSWMHTPHGGSRVYYPFAGGTFEATGEGGIDGEGTPGWP